MTAQEKAGTMELKKKSREKLQRRRNRTINGSTDESNDGEEKSSENFSHQSQKSQIDFLRVIIGTELTLTSLDDFCD